MPLSLGNSAHNTNGGATSITLTLSYSSGSFIVCDITTNGPPITAVSSAALGAFTHHVNSPSDAIERWHLVATSAQTNDTITVTQTTALFITADVYEIKGANTSSPYDSGGPQTSDGPDPKSITTANANTMVIAAFRESSTASPTAGSGFTQISGADFQLTEYEILSSAQTLSCTQTTGAGNSNGLIIDAIVAAAAGTIENYAAFKGRTYPSQWSPTRKLWQTDPQDTSSFGVETNPHWRGRTWPMQWNPLRALVQNSDPNLAFQPETNPHFVPRTWPVSWNPMPFGRTTAQDLSSFGVETNPHWIGKLQVLQWAPLRALMQNVALDVPATVIDTPVYIIPRQWPLAWNVDTRLFRITAQDFSSLGVPTNIQYAPRTWPFQWNVQQSLMRGTAQDFSSTPPVVIGFHIVTPMGARLISPIGI